jgi:GLPGLI family protein
MKTLFIASICILGLAVQLKAQPKKSGAIQFESTFDPAAMAAANGIKLSEQALARMPQNSVSNFELLFNLSNASYMPVEDTEDSNNSAGGGGQGGGGMRFGGFGAANRDYFYSFADHKLSIVLDLNDTAFIMPAKLGDQSQMGFGMQQAAPAVEFLRTDETKKILGFTCHKLIVKTTVKRKIQEEEKVITDETNVWFTNDLGFDFSPNPGFWTEGAVLAIEGKGTHVYAKSIEFRKVSEKDVSIPKKVIPITPEELRQKMEARRKQFRGNRAGNNGQVRTITIN